MNALGSDVQFVFAESPYQSGVWYGDPPGGKSVPTTSPSWAQTSIDYLDGIVNSSGPFDGIMGYSQGSPMAFVYISSSATRMAHFRFIVTFCGYLPTTHTGLTNLIYDVAPINLSSLFYMGSADTLISNDQTNAAAAQFSNAMMVADDGGHEPPASGTVAFNSIISFINSFVSLSGTLPPSLPSPPINDSCDTIVIGCGLAGATAFFTSSVVVNRSSCIICPSLETSTSANSGNGWLLLTSVYEKSNLLNQLETRAQTRGLHFDMERASYFMDKTMEAVQLVKNELNVSFEPVPAFADNLVTNCTSVRTCCENGTRDVPFHGTFSCMESRVWYTRSGCCNQSSNTLSDFDTWPAYLHLNHALKNAVTWIVNDTSSTPNIPTLDFIYAMINATLRRGSQLISGNVNNVTKNQTNWIIHMQNQILSTENIIFASGGFGSHATSEEYVALGVHSAAQVHAYNSRLLWTLASEQNWTKDSLNAWYLEFVDGAPQWFLWDPMATVMTLQGELIYDESASYDERGRQRKYVNNTDAYYITFDPSSNVTVQDALGTVFSENLLNQTVTKECNTRSKRLWRNFLANQYPQYFGPIVNMNECSARVGSTTPVRIRRIFQGIIDTISGPIIDKYQRVMDSTKAYACGNAASPGLYPTYLAPGSTLGNAFVGGYIAGLQI